MHVTKSRSIFGSYDNHDPFDITIPLDEIYQIKAVCLFLYEMMIVVNFEKYEEYHQFTKSTYSHLVIDKITADPANPGNQFYITHSNL